MRSLLVELDLTTPLCGDFRPTGDAIYVGELAARYGDEAALAALHQHVRFTDDVPHASCILLNGVLDSGATTCVSNLLQEWLYTDPATMAGHRTMNQGKGNNAPAITVKGTSYKAENLFNRYPVVTTSLVAILVVGDADNLGQVFEDVWAIGKRRAAGWGRVGDVRISEVDQDPDTWGLIDNAGNAVRAVPLPLHQRLTGQTPLMLQNARARPFYWSAATPQLLCAVPHSSLLEDFVL